MLTPEQQAYLDNVKLYLAGQEARETVMRPFEIALEIPEQMADDFRRNLIVKCYLLGDKGAFDWLANRGKHE